MHPEFADWYRGAGVAPPEGLVQKRWDGVEALAAAETEAVLLGLLRLFTLPNVTEAACPAEVRAAFREHDESFPSSGNLEELRVLAGAVLRQMFDSSAPFADAAALGILAACYPSRIQRIPTERHFDAADAYCVLAATAKRRRPKGPRFSLPDITKERFGPIFQPALAGNFPALAEPIRGLLNLVLSSVTTGMEEAVASLEAELRTKDEELDYLWWLTAAHSRALDAPFPKVGALIGSLVYPAELAELTAHVPGPASAIAILFQALLISGAVATSDKASLQDAVNATPPTWREHLIAQVALGDLGPLCPIHFAIVKSLDADGPTDWLPVYRKACDVRPDGAITLGMLARQAYRERLFVHALREARE